MCEHWFLLVVSGKPSHEFSIFSSLLPGSEILYLGLIISFLSLYFWTVELSHLMVVLFISSLSRFMMHQVVVEVDHGEKEDAWLLYNHFSQVWNLIWSVLPRMKEDGPCLQPKAALKLKKILVILISKIYIAHISYNRNV